jgi:hypothetical protein
MTLRETSTIDRDQLDTFHRQASRCLERLDQFVKLDSPDVVIRNEIRCLQMKCERFFREDICGPDAAETIDTNGDEHANT